jgi:AraC-like DNA-binding protein
METLNAHVEGIPRDVVVTTIAHQGDTTFPMHLHQRGQFVFVETGSVTVFTPRNSWLIPPDHACWVPARTPHEMEVRGHASILNTFVNEAVAQRLTMPNHCKVLNISSLLRSLLREAASIPPLYDIDQRDGRLMALLLDEIAVMPELPLNTRLPREPRLYRICRDLIDNPRSDATLDDIAALAGVSRRTFTRLFKQQTGLSFAVWKQQMCLLAAIRRISKGEALTRIAFDLGYSSPSAFTVAFRRFFKEAPSRYLATTGD